MGLEPEAPRQAKPTQSHVSETDMSAQRGSEIREVRKCLEKFLARAVLGNVKFTNEETVRNKTLSVREETNKKDF